MAGPGYPDAAATSTLTGSIPYGCLSYYAPSQIPNLVALATKFVVSDETYSMADSPSWGGHVYAVAGTNDDFTGENPSIPHPTPVGYVQGSGLGLQLQPGHAVDQPGHRGDEPRARRAFRTRASASPMAAPSSRRLCSTCRRSWTASTPPA